MPSSMQRVVLCADDFGLTEAVSRGIVDLTRMSRLSAVSVMSNRPWASRVAPDLAGAGEVGIGLHLTLTLGQPVGPMPRFGVEGNFPTFREVLRQSLLGQLPHEEVRQECERQLAAFEAAFGRPPDFVDGHQHVHVLPGIREQLFAALKARGWNRRLWIRDPSDRVAAILRRRVSRGKALIVRGLALGLRTAAQRAGLGLNEGFSGFSPFDPARDVAVDFASFLAHLGPRPVVMCHPGLIDDELRTLDPVTDMREHEYAYLASEAFPALLQQRGIVLVASPT